MIDDIPPTINEIVKTVDWIGIFFAVYTVKVLDAPSNEIN